RRSILKSVNGKFRAGELTAIMGPSGAGKSTLMNILVGYVSSGVTGMIKTNGHPRQLKLFHKLCSYIMQEDLIQPYLSVQESMEIAANLKLGTHKNQPAKLHIEEVLRTLGLLTCRDTRTECLSGGQKKRLSIALELVNNPPVIFLDEPTTGLDIFSIKQVLGLLKLLAQQGRTIICTIHQPSASHFELFDQVYIVAKGHCVYQGASNQLVPFLSTVGLNCPKHHKPSRLWVSTEIIFAHPKLSSILNHLIDNGGNKIFSERTTDTKSHGHHHSNSGRESLLLEMIQGEFVDNVKCLSAEIQNGKLCRRNENSTTESLELDSTGRGITKICRQETLAVMPAVFNHALMDTLDDSKDFEFPTSFSEQFLILLKRLFVQQARNTVALWIQLFHHVFSAILVGFIFLQMGEDASRVIANLKFCLCIVMFFLYTHIMTPVLLLPSAIKHMKREFFNRWYGLKAYYAALTVASFPPMITFGFIFCLVSYFLSSQPMDMNRFMAFFASGIAIGMASEAHGLIVGVIFSAMNGSIVAPASFSPLLALAVYGMGHGTSIETYMSFLMCLSYLRYGLVSIVLSIYGNNREKMMCGMNEYNYCHYEQPKLLLRDIGMSDVTIFGQILALIGFSFVYRTVAYLFLRYRLTSEFSNQILNYAAKILRHK
ncbi:hypothetical protein L9F63_022846, partial [Diploptera punctata]